MTIQAITAAQDSIQAKSHMSQIMFDVGDEVRAKSDMHPFWMTITAVNERTGFCRCMFGFSGRDAGNFHFSELQFHGGVEIDAALAS